MSSILTLSELDNLYAFSVMSQLLLGSSVDVS